MAARARLLGYGERASQSDDDEGYYGSSNPGHELAQAVLAQRAAKRSDEEAASLEEERKANAAWRTHQQQREDEFDPISMALARAHLAGLGIRGPGQGGGGGGIDVQGGLPSAGIMAGSRSAPIQGVGASARNASGPMPDVGNRTQGMDSGFLGPAGRNPDPGFTAHDLPGAFNPVTGTHNPADIDLGGGYSMPYSATPEGRGAASARELMESGIPNMTPALALYLSQHPEHVGPMLAQARGRGAIDPYGPEALQFHKSLRDYEVAHPVRDPAQERPVGGLTMEQALYEARAMPGASDVSAPGRDYLRAQKLYYAPGGMGFRGRGLPAPRRAAAAPPAAAPAAPTSAGQGPNVPDMLEQAADTVAGARGRGMSDEEIRTRLKGKATDQQIEQILAHPRSHRRP